MSDEQERSEPDPTPPRHSEASKAGEGYHVPEWVEAREEHHMPEWIIESFWIAYGLNALMVYIHFSNFGHSQRWVRGLILYIVLSLTYMTLGVAFSLACQGLNGYIRYGSVSDTIKGGIRETIVGATLIWLCFMAYTLYREFSEPSEWLGEF